jgi:DHA3 family multidrug efflux protein-like MFS transporter
VVTTTTRAAPGPSAAMSTFHQLVGNTLLASVTNNFLWFALTFWVYLETRSVLATAIIGGTYMLLLAGSGLLFGTFIDGHRRKTSMLVSSTGSIIGYAGAAVIYRLAPEGSLQDLTHPAFWGFVILVLAGAITGNLRTVALSTTVTLLVPEDRRDKANGLVGTVNGVSFTLTSVFSGLAIGFLGMGWSVLISVALTAVAGLHLLSIPVAEQKPEPPNGKLPLIDLRGAVTAVRLVPGLVGLILFTTLNNLLGGVFMALVDPYGLSLVSVEVWGILLAVMSSGFIVGGLVVARKGLGARPLRLLLLINVAMWTITTLFPVRSSIVLLTVGFMLYMCLIPAAEAAEQTILQKVVPFTEQGRVFGFAQTVETIASPVTAFLIGPIAQFWVIPSMTDGAGADLIGSWFGTGADRGMALLFIGSGLIGVVITLLAFRTRSYERLSDTYATPRPEVSEAS